MSRHLARSIVSVIFLLVLILPALSAFAQPDEIPCESGVNYERRAENSMDEGAYASAVEAYTCVLQADPTTFDAYLGRGNARVLASAIDHEPYSLDTTFDYSILRAYAP